MRYGLKLATFASVLSLVAGGAAHASCPALPNNIVNGQTADASKLMADLNQLQDCANGVNGTVVVPPVPSLSVTGGAGAVTIRNPSATAAYDFDLPQTPGVAGNVLTSNGPGLPMSWTSIPGLAKPPIVDGLPVARPVASAFSWMNQGGAVMADHSNVNGPLTLVVPSGTTTTNYRGIYQAPPSGPFTLTVKLDDMWYNASTFTHGIYVADSTGKMLVLNFYSIAGSQLLYASHLASPTSSQSTITSYGIMERTAWLRIYDDGTNWNLLVSANGVDWVKVYSETLTNYLGSTIAQAGVIGLVSNSSANANNNIAIWSYELKSGAGTDSSW